MKVLNLYITCADSVFSFCLLGLQRFRYDWLNYGTERFISTFRTLLVSHSIEPGLVTKTEILLLECGVINGNIDIKMFENGCCYRIAIINLWRMPLIVEGKHYSITRTSIFICGRVTLHIKINPSHIKIKPPHIMVNPPNIKVKPPHIKIKPLHIKIIQTDINKKVSNIKKTAPRINVTDQIRQLWRSISFNIFNLLNYL